MSAPGERRRGAGAWDDGVRRLAEAFAADETLASVRHDVLSKLTGIGNLAHLVRRRLEAGNGLKDGTPPAGELLDLLRRDVGVATSTLDRRLVAPPARGARLADAAAVAARAASSFEGAIALGGARQIDAAIDEQELEVALACLLDNARDASPPARDVRLTCAPGAPGELTITIEDDGDGLSAEALARAFEPFFTTKPGRVGLGLTIARRIAARWSGSVALALAPRHGTRVVLTLPRAPHASHAAPAPPSGGPPRDD